MFHFINYKRFNRKQIRVEYEDYLKEKVKKAKGRYLTVLKKFANPKIDGTQIPTNRPSSL